MYSSTNHQFKRDTKNEKGRILHLGQWLMSCRKKKFLWEVEEKVTDRQ